MSFNEFKLRKNVRQSWLPFCAIRKNNWDVARLLIKKDLGVTEAFVHQLAINNCKLHVLEKPTKHQQ